VNLEALGAKGVADVVEDSLAIWISDGDILVRWIPFFDGAFVNPSRAAQSGL